MSPIVFVSQGILEKMGPPARVVRRVISRLLVAPPSASLARLGSTKTSLRCQLVLHALPTPRRPSAARRKLPARASRGTPVLTEACVKRVSGGNTKSRMVQRYAMCAGRTQVPHLSLQTTTAIVGAMQGTRGRMETVPCARKTNGAQEGMTWFLTAPATPLHPREAQAQARVSATQDLAGSMEELAVPAMRDISVRVATRDSSVARTKFLRRAAAARRIAHALRGTPCCKMLDVRYWDSLKLSGRAL